MGTPMTDMERAERIRKLQDRRSTSTDVAAKPGQGRLAQVAGIQDRPAAGVTPTPAARRLRHPAALSRLGALSLSASLTLSLMGTIASADPTPAFDPNPVLPPPSTGALPVPVVLVPVQHILHLVAGAGSSNNWTATPGAVVSATPGSSGQGQQVTGTNGSK